MAEQSDIAQEIYAPYPLNVNSSDIRLVVIAPSESRDADLQTVLMVQSLDDRLKYGALSYHWGPPSSHHFVYINGLKYNITAQLDAALRHLRDSQDLVTLWIDALCINQQNILERNNQVRQMDQIYKQATMVLIWLGEAYAQSDDAMDFIVKSQNMEPDDVLTSPIRTETLKALKSLFDRPWWKRVWVIQEVTVASLAYVMCGDKAVPWRFFEEAAIFFSYPKAGKHLGTLSVIDFCVPDTDKALSIVRLRRAYRGESNYSRHELERLLFDTSEHMATDPADKVYGLLGLLDPTERNALPIDYGKSVTNVYKDAMLLMLASSQNRYRLTVIEFGPGPKSHPLPSWCPDFSKHRWCEDWFPHHWFYGSVNATGASGVLDRTLFTYSSHNSSLRASGVIVGNIDYTEHALPTMDIPSISDALAADEHPGSTGQGLANYFNLLLQYLRQNLATVKYLRVKFYEKLRERMSAEGATACVKRGDLFQLLQRNHELTYPANLTPAERFKDLERVCSVVFDDGRLDDLSENDRLILKDSLSRLSVSWRQCCFISTDTGYFGRARFSIKKGDLACILFGCQMPAILRPRGYAYEIISFAAIHGLMYGEFVANDKGLDKKDFNLV